MVRLTETSRRASGSSGCCGGEVAGDIEALVIGGQRPVLVAGAQTHVADLVEADRQVALGLQALRVLGQQAAGEGQTLLIGIERTLAVAGLDPDVTEIAPG